MYGRERRKTTDADHDALRAAQDPSGVGGEELCAAVEAAVGALLLGGAATVFGPVVGAMLFWFLLAIPDALLRQAISGPDPLLPLTDAQVGATRYVLLGILIMVLMIFRPQGILGNKREVQLDG